jgi:hypothetical protein
VPKTTRWLTRTKRRRRTVLIPYGQKTHAASRV